MSTLGIVPKKENGEYRLIHHLSYPENVSINDGIAEAGKSVSYATLDNAISLVKGH